MVLCPEKRGDSPVLRIGGEFGDRGSEVESGQRAERGQNPMGLPQCNDLPKLKPCLVRVYIGLMYGYISHIIPLFFFFFIF